MIKMILALVVLVFLGFGDTAKAYLLVEDIPNLSTNIVNEVRNYAQYLSQTANQVTQITNQVTQIENQVIALERFGNPQYYVNLLGLSSFMATASVLTSGIGQTLSSYRQAANGVRPGIHGQRTVLEFDRIPGSIREPDPVQYRRVPEVRGGQRHGRGLQHAAKDIQRADGFAAATTDNRHAELKRGFHADGD